jgi:hypothetical protein
MLHVSGASVESGAISDAFEVLVDDHSELSAVLLDVRSAEPARPGLAQEALSAVREAIFARAPMYEIVSSIRSFSASEQKLQVAISLVRFSQPDSRVEILNAGMPAIACLLGGGRLTLHPALSPAIGKRFGEVHPYELSPLVWGSAWMLMSDGLTQGSTHAEEVRTWVMKNQLHKELAELAGQGPELLKKLILRTGGATTAAEHGDASLVVVNADPNRRFQSGIVP